MERARRARDFLEAPIGEALPVLDGAPVFSGQEVQVTVPVPVGHSWRGEVSYADHMERPDVPMNPWRLLLARLTRIASADPECNPRRGTDYGAALVELDLAGRLLSRAAGDERARAAPSVGALHVDAAPVARHAAPVDVMPRWGVAHETMAAGVAREGERCCAEGDGAH